MPSSTPEVRELFDRSLQLSREDRESLALELLDSLEAEPVSSETILRRSDEIRSGKVVPLTREEAEAEVRTRLSELGVEL